MIRAIGILTGGLVLLGAAGSFAPSVPDDVDYSAFPPQPSETRKMLDGVGVKIADAVRTAESEVGGAAKSAHVNMDGASAEIIVSVFAESTEHTVRIDATSGQVVANEVVNGDWTETDSGLRYYDVRVGDGAQPEGPATTVRVHYTGWLVDGRKFDSSVDRGQPINFPLNRVIAGWTEGVAGMRVGGKRRLFIPFHLGYGEQGRPPTIPARATLIFDVELLDIIE